MDPITLRFIERILAVLIGGIAVYLGYRLFIKVPESRDSQGKVTLPWNITVALTRVGPGVFFALFGAAIVGLSLYKGMEQSEQAPSIVVEAGTPVARAGGEQRAFRWAAAPAVHSDAAARVDARALLRRDIALLNTLDQMLPADLAGDGRARVEASIPRIKLALMRPVWGDEEAGWGTPQEFEAWLKDGEPDPAPPRIARAVEYFRYARSEAKP